jgi:protein-L-isoaspartate(D-aspartate) O-methyltransferase
MGKTDAQKLNEKLIESLKRRGDLTSPALEAALRATPRHHFLPGASLEDAYADEAVPVKRDNDGTILSSISQPGMIVAMLQQLQLRPGDNVLEIGAGTGYVAALIHHIVTQEGGKVTSIELDQDLAQLAVANLQRIGLASAVNIVQADGTLGYAPRASYDRILASASIWDVPPAWERQLKPNGRLVAPIWLNAFQVSAAFACERGGTLFSPHNIPCGFVRLRGTSVGPRVYRRVGTSSLTLISDNVGAIDSAAVQQLLSNDADICHTGHALRTRDYWSSFLPYLMLHLPPGYTFVLYGLIHGQAAYGIESDGFALLTQGSATFAPYNGEGKAHCFGSADAYIALLDSLRRWEAARRPSIDRLRLRLYPPGGTPPQTEGVVYTRGDHLLHLWLADEDKPS